MKSHRIGLGVVLGLNFSLKQQDRLDPRFSVDPEDSVERNGKWGDRVKDGGVCK